jgi:L-malate glycosyltransferase
MIQHSVFTDTPEQRELTERKSVPLYEKEDAGHPLRVFYLVDSFDVGGTEIQAAELALRMSRRGHRVTLGCLKAQGPVKERLQGSSVEVAEFHPKGGIDSIGGAYQLLRLSWFLREGGFDIVHTHDLWSNLLGIPAARLAGVPVVISSRRDLGHLDWYQGKRRAWLRRIQNLSHIVLTNATPIREALVEDGFSAEKLRVIWNGIDVGGFNRIPDRRRLFPQAAGQLIVLVGNMHSEVKGHRWLIESAPAIVAEFPSAQFVLVGDGAKRREFESQVQAFGLSEKFIFAGRRDDVPEILACCDIAVLPSLAEGLPNAVLEYMAASLPVVVSNAGGNVELVEDGVTGMLVAPRDSKALTRALLYLLKNPALASQMARRGHELVTQNFSFERLVQQVEQLYSELLRNRARIS